MLAQCRNLAESKPAPSGKQEEGSPSLRHSLNQFVELLGRDEGALVLM